jgi:hypothetical protein
VLWRVRRAVAVLRSALRADTGAQGISDPSSSAPDDQEIDPPSPRRSSVPRRSDRPARRLPHAPGLPPIGPLGEDLASPGWCGHAWTDWSPLTIKAIVRLDAASGLYRPRTSGAQLAYIGEGAIWPRLLAYAATLQTATPRGDALRANAPLAFSLVRGPDWLRHQRLELETEPHRRARARPARGIRTQALPAI